MELPSSLQQGIVCIPLVRKLQEVYIVPARKVDGTQSPSTLTVMEKLLISPISTAGPGVNSGPNLNIGRILMMIIRSRLSTEVSEHHYRQAYTCSTPSIIGYFVIVALHRLHVILLRATAVRGPLASCR